MFENRSQKIISGRAFAARQLRFSLYSSLLVLFSLALGMVGYISTEGMSAIDGLLNASMILTGMGPVTPMTNDASKLFASFYALYSGIAFLTIIGLFIAPVAHRFMHKHHLDE
ncbi:MAG: hypothetical protein RL040_1265 [Bacteroidota bacterium]|jgi:hypothetical protein